jgi:hypothetical protein
LRAASMHSLSATCSMMCLTVVVVVTNDKSQN